MKFLSLVDEHLRGRRCQISCGQAERSIGEGPYSGGRLGGFSTAGHRLRSAWRLAVSWAT